MRNVIVSLLFLFGLYTLAAQSLDKTVRFDSSFSGEISVFLKILKTDKGLPLVFSPSALPIETINLKAGNYPAALLLDILLDYDLTYQLSEGEILIRRATTSRISGYVRDQNTGEALIGASVGLEDGTGVYTNEYGYFSMAAHKGSRIMKVSFVGFNSRIDTIFVQKPFRINYDLQAEPRQLDEIIVASIGHNYHVNSKVPGELNLDYQTKGQIPYFLGEIDVLQEMLLLPGIRSLGEDAGGLNIRGGATDQNLILVDEAPIYNPYHFFGLISVFNPEAVNHVKILKGFVPPSYGGRVSSVVSIYQKEGNNQSHHLSGGIGLVSARLMAEGPIQRDKSSYLISARQSLLDLSQSFINYQPGSRSAFSDINGKINWRINDRNTVYLSGYIGNDRFRSTFGETRNWGNSTLTLRWNKTLKKSWFSHFSGVLSDYTYSITNPVESGSFVGKSKIQDIGLKWDNLYYLPNSLVEFGIQGIYHKLKPGERLPLDEQSTSTNPVILESEQGIEMAGYLSHEVPISRRLALTYGIRYSALQTFGPKTVNTYEKEKEKSRETIIDSTEYTSGQRISFDQALEPRLSLKFMFSPRDALKFSYVRSNQYIHLLAVNAVPSPTDIWKLSDTHISPLTSDHFSLGYYKTFIEGWNGTAEVYYKHLQNLIDYKDGADLLLNENPETEIVNGDGQAYGLEMRLEKTEGKWKGWVSYTFSRALRIFNSPIPEEQINKGKKYPDYHDKPQDLSLVVINQLSHRLSASATFNYSTGRPITFPSGKYQFNNTIVPFFQGRNQDRISNYHRMDFSVKLLGKETKKNGTERRISDFWTLSIYNVYARKNAYTYFFRQSSEDPRLAEVVRYSVFGTIVPALTYNFRF